MNCIPQYYKNRVCLNVLAGSIKMLKKYMMLVMGMY